IQSGITVKLPPSGSRLNGFDRAHVITVSSGGSNPYYLDGHSVNLEQLKAGLVEKKNEGRRAIIHADEMAPFGRVQQASNIALSLGYEVAYAT
ncbi:hypothetical protein OV440_26100, partial [Salmonella enterica subsp. enterica serovar 1,4,[5],12:i:-]|nr:hypothetical protein [Salmonella enterica subsp. enterica serovar 1,4,[5],12:i:-]